MMSNFSLSIRKPKLGKKCRFYPDPTFFVIKLDDLSLEIHISVSKFDDLISEARKRMQEGDVKVPESDV